MQYLNLDPPKPYRFGITAICPANTHQWQRSPPVDYSRIGQCRNCDRLTVTEGSYWYTFQVEDVTFPATQCCDSPDLGLIKAFGHMFMCWACGYEARSCSRDWYKRCLGCKSVFDGSQLTVWIQLPYQPRASAVFDRLDDIRA